MSSDNDWATEAAEALKKDMEASKEEFVLSGAKLRDTYLEPPFSVLDAKSGSWQKRKAKWLELGIKSEEGRSVVVLPGASNNDYMPDMASSTSIFDPALCELMYKWFCPKGGTILDPFAGGSVRGIVAQKLGYKYTGIELRGEQVDSNRQQAKELLEADNQPEWIQGDSEKELDNLSGTYDMIFTCPPYANLEVYSKDPDDLSNMTYELFKEHYWEILGKAFNKLEQGGFFVIVVGDVRDERGHYLDFVGETKRMLMNPKDPFTTPAAWLYNDLILLDPIGTAMIRAANTFKSKKCVKVHQNVLVFKKFGKGD